MSLNDKQLAKLQDGREYRSMIMEIRAAENDEMIVEGYATTFNQPYVLYEDRDYTVMEQILPNAFDGCDMTDVIMQYNHDGHVYARTRNNTLQLMVDARGLKCTADLSGTDIGRQLYQEIKGGYSDQMSFGFRVLKDSRTESRDEETGHITVVRTIEKFKKLYDVSAVSIPANDMTSISARRSADGVIGEIKAERLARERRVKKIQIMTEV